MGGRSLTGGSDLYAVVSRASKSGKEVAGVQRNLEPGDCCLDGNRGDRNHTVVHLKEASYCSGRTLLDAYKQTPPVIENEGAAISEAGAVSLERRQPLTQEVAMLLDLAISRSRAEGHADEELKEQIRAALEATKQEIVHLRELVEESEREANQSQRMQPRRVSEKKLWS